MTTLHNKQTIKTKIKALEMACEMDKHIRLTLEKFKHHKNVTSRFTDALNEDPRFHSFIIREKFSTYLVVRDQSRDIEYAHKLEFRVYKSHCFNDNPLAWSDIEYDLDRYAYHNQLRLNKDMLQAFDKELVEFQKLYHFIEDRPFTCFDMYEFKRHMKSALEFASNGGDA